LLILAFPSLAAGAAPNYLWLEADHFVGVHPHGYASFDTRGRKDVPGWGINGPGVAAEWGQGGESEWNSIATPPDETDATASADVEVPAAGTYHVWVRYADWQFAAENFRVRVQQDGREQLDHEFGAAPVIDDHDEFKMYWGWVFAWDHARVELAKGSAEVSLRVDRPAEARRHVDVVLLTDDLAYAPQGREKPPFA
jgi:hypothetical protein